jgi:phage tail-like protein
MSHVLPTFQYVALEGGWPNVELNGLEVGASAELTLARLPALTERVTDPLAPVPGLDGPAGIGVDDCGNLYVADPANHQILRVDACDGTTSVVPCLTGPGSASGQLHTPRGVLAGPRDSLYVADSNNSRVQVFDLATMQLRGVWGGPGSTPARGRFQQPWDLAADSRDRIYVADPGVQAPDGRWSGGRVQKFDAGGTLDGAFTERIEAQPRRPGAPVSVAISLLDPKVAASERLIVLDRQPPQVLAYELDGTFDADATARWEQAVGVGAMPSSLAAGGGNLYIADAANQRVLVFGLDGSFRGVAGAGNDTIAGLAIDCEGRLLAHPGGAGSVRRSLGLSTFAECGTFLAGPFAAPSEPTLWQRVQATTDSLPNGAHVRLFTLTSNVLDGSPGNRPAMPVGCDGSVVPNLVRADDPGAAPIDSWRAGPWDAPDVLALNAPASYLWIAGQLEGDGRASPTIRQVRLTHDDEGWIRHLPAIYRNDRTSRVFLERALAGFESVFAIEDALIDDLPLLFDPAAASDAPRPSWLEWLSGWVDVELGETWSDDQRRRVVGEAFTMHGRRGTLESLRRLVALYTGAVPFIQELGSLGVWSLGTTALGFDTALAAAEPQGAVVGSTAVVNRSHLIRDEAYGAPALGDDAHRFVVQVYSGALRDADGLARVRQVIDREKPAHTTYHLCAIEPRMRVGAQARLGIDTIVAGPPQATPLGDEAGLVLAGSAGERAVGGVIGETARVGTSATVA